MTALKIQTPRLAAIGRMCLSNRELTNGYTAYELGKKNVRVNLISAGLMRTVAARSIPGFGRMYTR